MSLTERIDEWIETLEFPDSTRVIRQKLRGFIGEYSKKVPILGAYCHPNSSLARGQAMPGSDIDYLLIVREGDYPRGDEKNELMLLFRHFLHPGLVSQKEEDTFLVGFKQLQKNMRLLDERVRHNKRENPKVRGMGDLSYLAGTQGENIFRYIQHAAIVEYGHELRGPRFYLPPAEADEHKTRFLSQTSDFHYKEKVGLRRRLFDQFKGFDAEEQRVLAAIHRNGKRVNVSDLSYSELDILKSSRIQPFVRETHSGSSEYRCTY
jgi:hypothetical protein